MHIYISIYTYNPILYVLICIYMYPSIYLPIYLSTYLSIHEDFLIFPGLEAFFEDGGKDVKGAAAAAAGAYGAAKVQNLQYWGWYVIYLIYNHHF